MKKADSGFTLIELVIVIVLLGILSVTALPKFINFSGDARAAVVESVAQSIKAAAELTHSKALMQKKATIASSSVTVNGQNIPIAYGYPTAHQAIMNLVEVGSVGNYGRTQTNSNYDWVVHYWNWTTQGKQVPAIVIAQGVITGDLDATAPLQTNCYVRYVQAAEDIDIEVVSETSGC